MILDPMPVPEAAQLLGISANRVRALAANGRLPASKIGDRWLVERGAVEDRRRNGGVSGRPFEPRNAWALLFLASGQDVDGIDPSVRSRLRRALAVEGLVKLLPRLVRCAEPKHFSAHSGEVRYLLEDPALVKAGISAAGTYDLGLVPGHEVDCYLPASGWEKFAEDHALSGGSIPGNVRVRLVPDKAWPLLAGTSVAPLAAVALDLVEDFDARSNVVGRTVLAALDRGLRNSGSTEARLADS